MAGCCFDEVGLPDLALLLLRLRLLLQRLSLLLLFQLLPALRLPPRFGRWRCGGTAVVDGGRRQERRDDVAGTPRCGCRGVCDGVAAARRVLRVVDERRACCCWVLRCA